MEDEYYQVSPTVRESQLDIKFDKLTEDIDDKIVEIELKEKEVESMNEDLEILHEELEELKKEHNTTGEELAYYVDRFLSNY